MTPNNKNMSTFATKSRSPRRRLGAMRWTNVVVWLALCPYADAASTSRPVRNDSEIAKVMDWAKTQDYFYGSKNETKKPSVSYHTREHSWSAAAVKAALKGDATTSALPAPLGGGNGRCPMELELLWSTQLGSSVYSTPTAVRSMFGDGGVQLVAPTFVRYLELIEGGEGLAPAGWPLAFDLEDPEGGDDGLDGGSGGAGGAGGAKEGTRGRVGGRGPALFHGSAAVHDVNGDGRDDMYVDGSPHELVALA